MGSSADEAGSPPQNRLWRYQDVYWCRLGTTIIVLDVARDRYLSLRLPSDEIAQVIRALKVSGVLSTNADESQSPVCIHPSAAHIALDFNVPRRRKFRWKDVFIFLVACGSTLWSLRCRSLQDAIGTVVARKSSHESDAFDADRAADLIAIFRRLRSFSFGGHRRCLFHSLALVSFLSRYGVYGDFVMGVRIEPWAAHSWVQAGEYVLDGTPEQVRFFTPILTA
jgi:hypothetical protein